MAIRNEPLGDQLARQLRREIFSGNRSVGELLIEKSLSEEFGLSRGPVRDALQQLEHDGLIESEGRSLRVARFDASDISEIYELRASLEELAVERALAAEPDWSASHDAIAAMQVAAAAGDTTAFALADLSFHSSLFESVPQRRVHNAYRTVERTLGILIEFLPALHDDLHSMTTEHQHILDSIESGDNEWRALLARHLELGCDMLCVEFSRHSAEALQTHTT